MRDIYVPKGKTHGARPGAKVVAVVEEWSSPNLNPEGKIVEILGKTGEVRAEMMSVVRMFNLPGTFPSNVAAESENIPSEIPLLVTWRNGSALLKWMAGKWTVGRRLGSWPETAIWDISPGKSPSMPGAHRPTRSEGHEMWSAFTRIHQLKGQLGHCGA